MLLVFSLGTLVLISEAQITQINTLNEKYTNGAEISNQDTILSSYTTGEKIMYYFWVALLPIMTNVLNFGISTAI